MLFAELPPDTFIDVPLYERRAPGVADLLDYEVLVTDAVIGHKGGGLIAAFDFAGPPHDSTEAPDLDQAEDQLLYALADLGSGWVLHFDFQRHHDSTYPCMSAATDPAATRIEAIRRTSFLGKPQFISRSTVWLSHFPERTAETFFVRPKQDLDACEAALEALAGKVGHATKLSRLSGDELVGRLRSTLHVDPPRPITLHPAAFLDSMLAPGLERLHSGTLHVGERFAVPLRLTSLPKRLFSGAMLPLATSKIPLRLTTRLVMLSGWHADEAIDKGRRRRETSHFSWRTLIRSLIRGRAEAKQAEEHDRAEGLSPNESFQRERLLEANRALEASYRDDRFAYFATTILALGDSEAEANDNAEQILGVLRAARLDAGRDTYNEVQAYLGTAPGNAWANHRRYLQPLRAALALQPLTGTWEGSREPPHPLLRGHGPLAVVRTASDEAFFLNLHPGGEALSDLGHTLVLGPSGSGKSVLLNFIAASARRYPKARVLSLDIDRSQMVHCLAAEGSFYDPRAGHLSFAPLFLLRDRTPEARALTLSWLMTLWDATHKEPLADTDAEHLADALEEVVALDPDLHTLDVLAAKVQSPALRALLARYCGAGEHAALFGGHANAIDASAYTVIELRGLLGMRPEAKTPAFAHLLQLVQHNLDGHPAWVLIDEGSHFLGDQILAKGIHDWLITLRKRNASVVFATQSLGHFNDPALRQVFSESCPTRIFLPNPAAATNQDVRASYEAAGLTPRQIARIAEAQPKRQYLLVQPTGERLIDLDLSATELAILGASSPADLERVEALRRTDPVDWLDAWISERTTPQITQETSS